MAYPEVNATDDEAFQTLLRKWRTNARRPEFEVLQCGHCHDIDYDMVKLVSTHRQNIIK